MRKCVKIPLVPWGGEGGVLLRGKGKGDKHLGGGCVHLRGGGVNCCCVL